MRKALLGAAVLLLPILMQAQVKLLRHPTYSKGKVAFSYLGDIWIANENGSDVLRLTDNKARDQFPRFSPDGSTDRLLLQPRRQLRRLRHPVHRRQAAPAHVPQRGR